MINKIYEDSHILVVDKPCGLIVNRSRTARSKTLQDYIEEDYTFSGNSEAFISRSGIVHRLDKDTSGVLLVAKEEAAFYELLRQFKEREVKKEYLAIVHGHIKDKIIEIDAPIGRNPNTPMKFAVISDGRAAFTRFELIKTFTREEIDYTMLKALPKTGRTHQIRVHLGSIGHFVVGDKTYCTNNLLLASENIFNRMMLHASNLKVKHPVSGKIVDYNSKIPDDFNI